MTERTATCACGQLSITVTGEPVRVSICHCLDCQKRTGSLFGAQARFPRDRVAMQGQSTEFVRVADSGGILRFRFCPQCGTTLHYTLDAQPDLVAVATGGFADPAFPAPAFSVWESRKHDWIGLPEDSDISRSV